MRRVDLEMNTFADIKENNFTADSGDAWHENHSAKFGRQVSANQCLATRLSPIDGTAVRLTLKLAHKEFRPIISKNDRPKALLFVLLFEVLSHQPIDSSADLCARGAHG